MVHLFHEGGRGFSKPVHRLAVHRDGSWRRLRADVVLFLFPHGLAPLVCSFSFAVREGAGRGRRPSLRGSCRCKVPECPICGGKEDPSRTENGLGPTDSRGFPRGDLGHLSDDKEICLPALTPTLLYL